MDQFFRAVWQRAAKWYKGRYVPYDNSSDDSIIIIGGEYQRHWSARLMRVLLQFFLKHWQWLWTAAIAVAGIWASLVALR